MLSKEECQGTQPCDLERLIASMLLFSNDTLAQDSKGMSAKGRLHSVLAPLLCLLYVLDLHCAQSISSYRQHTRDTKGIKQAVCQLRFLFYQYRNC